MRRFASLRRQADFTRLRRRGRRLTTAHLTIYCSDVLPGDPASLVGISVSKSIGNAVVRNKLRRRLAAIVHDALAQTAAMRLLVIPRPGAADVAFAALRDDVTSALARG